MHDFFAQIFDDFTLRCGGAPQFSSLYFNFEDKDGVQAPPGVVYGEWVQAGFHIPLKFPNTIVDVKYNEATDDYDWALEFQCVEKYGVILFYGINFYAKDSTNPAVLEEMKASAYAHGLGHFIDEGNALKILDHSECVYPDPVVPSPAPNGHETTPTAAAATTAGAEENNKSSSLLRGMFE